MLAAGRGHTDVVTAILEKDASLEVISVKDRWGETALMKASGSGHTDVVTAILEKDASPGFISAKDSYGKTALMKASGRGHTNVVMAILAKDSTQDTALLEGFTSYAQFFSELNATEKHAESLDASQTEQKDAVLEYTNTLKRLTIAYFGGTTDKTQVITDFHNAKNRLVGLSPAGRFGFFQTIPTEQAHAADSAPPTQFNTRP
jgi:hypothetical protein